jgi:hypothetical protein
MMAMLAIVSLKTIKAKRCVAERGHANFREGQLAEACAKLDRTTILAARIGLTDARPKAAKDLR